MKKSLAFLIVMALAVTCAMTAFAAPAAPNGYQTTSLFDFSAVAAGETTLGTLGWWAPGGESVVVNAADGKVTLNQACWGAFPGITAEGQEAFKNKDGWGFYVETADAETSFVGGFNSNEATDSNYSLLVDKPCFLYSVNGVRTDITTVANAGFGQGAVPVPANFKGYIFIPFSAYSCTAENNKHALDINAAQPATPIFGFSGAESTTYGEFFVFTGAPATADLSVIAYAAAAILGLGSLAIVRKKK